MGLLASAATSAGYNMILQLTFRLVTFVLNAFILRYISKSALGIVNVRLALLYTTTLFVAREAFRRACLSKTTQHKWRQVINLLWCTLPIGVVCAATFGAIWAYVLEQPHAKQIPHYHTAVLAFALSTIIEMTAEPLYVVAQLLLFVRLKVFVEGVALAGRCILTVIFVIYFPKWGLIAFSIAQVTFTALYALMYYAYFTYYIISNQGDENFPFKSIRDFFPRLDRKEAMISWNMASLTWSFFKQSFLKQILTEGERYVMTIFKVLSFADQGIYDVINNLGSLAARFIFLPIEDSAYLLFSQTLTRGVPASQQSQESVTLISHVLENLLKIVSTIGLIFLVFGFSYSFLLLDLYAGTILSAGSGPVLLRWYCMYVLVLAVNGVTESFVFATMSKQELDRYNHKMLVFSVLFLSSSWYLTRWLGSVGFILANCLNMAARITHSIYYIHQYYKTVDYNPLSNCLPSPAVLIALACSFLMTAVSEKVFLKGRSEWFYRIIHVSFGGMCLCLVLGAIYLAEQRLISFISIHYRAHMAARKEVKAEEKKQQ